MSYNFDRLLAVGISLDDAHALRRISMTLQRWFELECGDGNDFGSWSIVRGKKVGKDFEYDDDGKPYVDYHSHKSNEVTYRLIADRERGALKRLKAIMAKYPTLESFVQTDPRGCALYIGTNLTDSNYSSQGIAVYK